MQLRGEENVLRDDICTNKSPHTNTVINSLCLQPIQNVVVMLILQRHNYNVIATLASTLDGKFNYRCSMNIVLTKSILRRQNTKFP